MLRRPVVAGSSLEMDLGRYRSVRYVPGTESLEVAWQGQWWRLDPGDRQPRRLGRLQKHELAGPRASDGRTTVTADRQAAQVRVRWRGEASTQPLPHVDAGVRLLALRPDGVLTVHQDGVARLWDLDARQLLRTSRSPGTRALVTDGQTVLSMRGGPRDGAVAWSPDKPGDTWVLPGTGDFIPRGAVSVRDGLLALIDGQGRCAMFRAATRAYLCAVETRSRTRAVAVLPGGSGVALYWGRALRVIDSSGRVEHTWDVPLVPGRRGRPPTKPWQVTIAVDSEARSFVLASGRWVLSCATGEPCGSWVDCQDCVTGVSASRGLVSYAGFYKRREVTCCRPWCSTARSSSRTAWCRSHTVRTARCRTTPRRRPCR